MFGDSVNQLAAFLFLFVVIPATIIGLVIGLGPRLIVGIFILIGKIFIGIFRLIFKIFKKSSSQFPESYKHPEIKILPSYEPPKILSSEIERSRFVIMNKDSKRAAEPLNASPIIHETPKRVAEPLTISHIRELSSKFFEIFIGIILGKLGFYGIKVTGKSHDEGIDLEAHQNNKLFVIQCKRYKDTVGRPDIQKLFGVMTDKKADGYLFTTGHFSKSAKEFSEGKPIKLINGEELIKICKENGIETNKQLLEEILKTFS